jgi:hypothetical protein
MEVVVAVSIVYRCLWTQILQHDSQKKFPLRKRYWWEIENLDLAVKSGMTLLFGVILLIDFSVSYVTKTGRIKRDHTFKHKYCTSGLLKIGMGEKQAALEASFDSNVQPVKRRTPVRYLQRWAIQPIILRSAI